MKDPTQGDFHEGDAEELPYANSSFGFVVSMFGAMFAPRPELVIAELLRVTRNAGTIAMANWTPTSFIGRIFKTIGSLDVSHCFLQTRSQDFQVRPVRFINPAQKDFSQFFGSKWLTQAIIAMVRSTAGHRLRKVEAIKVHHLVPGRDKIVNKFLLRVRASVNFRQGAELGV